MSGGIRNVGEMPGPTRAALPPRKESPIIPDYPYEIKVLSLDMSNL